MLLRYYRLLPAFAASLSLLLAGCGSSAERGDGPSGRLAMNTQKPVSTEPAQGIDTEATIWTVLGLAKKPSQRRLGPQVGDSVSPSLWLAAHDALNFVPVASEDPMTGILVTDWYTPRGKPNERLRVNVFVLSYALRSDSLSVTVDREERTPTGWQATPVDQQTVSDLETAILQRARQIHAETYRETVLEKE